MVRIIYRREGIQRSKKVQREGRRIKKKKQCICQDSSLVFNLFVVQEKDFNSGLTLILSDRHSGKQPVNPAVSQLVLPISPGKK